MFLPLHSMGNSNYLKLVLPNMHKFSQFWMFCNLHGILDEINKGKYDLPVQIKSLYLALFANFGHQSMHQVLQGINDGTTCYHQSEESPCYQQIESSNVILIDFFSIKYMYCRCIPKSCMYD